MTIQAIQTDYAGCRFRSRLEARWAVFFDQIGMAWQYEPQGFDLAGERYLPDFFLPTAAGRSGMWVEVKGNPASLDMARLRRVTSLLPDSPETTAACVFGPRLLLLGDLPDHPALHCGLCVYSVERDVVERQAMAFVHMRGMDGALVVPVGWSKAIDWTASQPEGWPYMILDEYLLVDPKTTAAYQAARSSRFEFGQSGVLV